MNYYPIKILFSIILTLKLRVQFYDQGLGVLFAYPPPQYHIYYLLISLININKNTPLEVRNSIIW